MEFFCVLGPRKLGKAIRVTFQDGTFVALCSSGSILGSLVPDSGRIGITRKRPPTTAGPGLPRGLAGRGVGDPALAAPPAQLSNDIWMSMLRQLVAELWPLEGLRDVTRVGTESPRARSCLAKWNEPLQYTYQMKALGLFRRMQSSSHCAWRFCQKTYHWRTISLEQDCVEPFPAQLNGSRPHNMHIE